MISGIRVNDNCVTEFNNMKIRKTCGWIIFVIQNCEIIIHSKGASTTLTELVQSIDKNNEIQCAYVVFDAGTSFIKWIIYLMHKHINKIIN
ncbi:hypothetical protein PFMALIP_00949 [Plasmodium falciparum MaliPS096_E11]|uniref:ADF-H domain-containing protein n=1 Tax=Plasmodium falciparum MaliPS096_E11 TaxID=1036727 RepID=A0A024WWZ6_PLAFA|nr:hypothetical protein PFMALIP_00949 [Plasmodium falciparum MaliPS096_E11]